MNGVTCGLKPDLSGLEWLKSQGYITVIQLRKNSADDADRTVIEKQGFRYESITITPETLNSKVVTQFNQLIKNSSNRPIFVYDADGAITGAMFYLYFRLVEMYNNDEAILRANRLGLKQDDTEEHRALMLAVQNFVAKSKN